MFDILDDNSNFSNFSSIPGSRSASMKKLPKKESRPSIFQQQKSSVLNPSKGFDDLINNFLQKQSKGNIFESQSFSKPNSRRGKFDALDSHFDDSSKARAESHIYGSTPSQLARSRTLKIFDEEENTPQELKLNNHFGKTQQTIFNPSKIEDSFVSSRNMKPPIKRRENMSNMSVNIKANDFGMTIPEEDPTLSNSSKGITEQAYRPARSINRRSSIDARSQVNSQDYFSTHQDHHVGTFRQDKVREQPLQKVSNTESHLISWFGKQSAKFSPNNTVKIEESKILAAHNQKKIIDEKQIEDRIAKGVKSVINDYEKQIEIMKQTYLKQINFLQQSLEKQITETRQTRDKFFKESSRLIDQQRQRSKKMHQEEINRVKQMHLWQKSQITDTLRCEIQSLKNTLSLKNEICNRPSSSISIENENKQLRLRVWQTSLEQKSRMLQRRQNQLDLRIGQFNLQKMQSEQKLRSEQKRILQMQMMLKKQILTQKKGISEQKHRIANQIGGLELQIFKQKEENQMKARELQIERQSLMRQKDQLAKINQQIMLNHKENIDGIQQEKQKLSNLELELMKKIRTIQMGARQLQYHRNNQQDFMVVNHQISSKLKQKDRSFLKNRQLNKEVNTKSMSNLNKTKERFYEIEHNTKNKLNASIKDHKRLDLTTYMNRVQKFSKLRE